MFRLTSTSAAVAVAILAAGGSQPVLAHENTEAAMFGAGPDRVCHVLSDKRGEPVMEKSADEPVYTKFTEDCPEPEVVAEVAVIEPAAPPAEPLPERGVVYFDFARAELNPSGENTMGPVSPAYCRPRPAILSSTAVSKLLQRACDPPNAAISSSAAARSSRLTSPSVLRRTRSSAISRIAAVS